MDRVDCATGAALGGSLQSPLQWSSPDGGTGGSLSSTPSTVKDSGSPVAGTATIAFSQSLVTGEPVSQGDCYRLVATLTVT
jgi:hypothetical protein